MKRKFIVAIAALAAAASLTGCSTSAASDEIYVHKGNGIFENKGDKGCVTPSDREISGAMDDYYAYPANQRVYDFTVSKDHDGDPFQVVSKDGQPMTVPGTLSFALNVDCKVLQKFHDKIGNRYQAYMEDGQTGAGWAKMLNVYFRPSLDATLDRVAKQYEWRQLYSDPSIKDEINTQVNKQVETLINQQLEGNEKFFVNFSALIQQPQADAQLVQAVKDAETSEAQAAATEAKAKADASAAQAAANAQVAQKEAELKVAKIEAQIKQAEIASYGGPQKYNDYLAIQKGLNPYQPTYGGNVLNQVPTP